jgi:hypothetical protein
MGPANFFVSNTFFKNFRRFAALGALIVCEQSCDTGYPMAVGIHDLIVRQEAVIVRKTGREKEKG